MLGLLTYHEHIVPAGCRHLQRPLDVLLPLHLGQVYVELRLFQAPVINAASDSQ